MPNEKRKRLPLKDKVEVIHTSDKYKLSVRKLAEKYGVGKTQISEILKNKNELLKSFVDGSSNDEVKRKFPAVDQIVFEWFSKVRDKKIPLSGTLIKEKALEAAEESKCDTFKASNGWLEKFCKRHNITFKSVCGESAHITLQEVENWKIKLNKILEDYSAEDVYNVSSSNLFRSFS
ncbi:hypothetical protein JTB14_008664 [Gonioctena quinquepunctata]|nr:hypothetical protein JTB14_008664 [Gonioctena quinquepunctata]